MASSRLPFIRGRVDRADPYRSPRGSRSEGIKLPPRDPTKHKAALVSQLDAIGQQAASRSPGDRDPEAVRETIIVQPEPGFELEASPLSDKRGDVRLIGETEAGDVLLDAPSAELPHLRKKVEHYADDSQISEKGMRKNAPAIAQKEVVPRVP